KDVFSFDASTTVKAGLFIDGKLAGRIMKKDFIKNMASGRKVDFNRKPSEKFNKNGSFTLVNGVLESASLRKDNCLGWMNDDANFTVDLGTSQNVKKVTLYCMQEGIDFIILPKSVTVYYSGDDGKFTMAGKTKFSYSGEDYVKIEVTFDSFNARYVKLRADNPGKVTAGKVSHNKDFWLLLDEVVIE
ncbi:MAG: discoidin domain-containing protein, partial [Bacteroidia bacterium]|nr:discoidin domain-containing protein [Bacteroidia bacterium]